MRNGHYDYKVFATSTKLFLPGISAPINLSSGEEVGGPRENSPLFQRKITLLIFHCKALYSLHKTKKGDSKSPFY